MSTVILSIDQGTTSSRTLVFSPRGRILFTAQEEFPQIYPRDGWVEHDPETIWDTVFKTLKQAWNFAEANDHNVAGIGITNQRETTLVWNKETGDCLYNAIVWQDRRTAAACREMAKKMPVKEINAKSGLIHDPYFSGSKIAWIIDNVDGARDLAKAEKLAFGTVDCFLIWRLTEGKSHATDATNASRTNLFNIHTQEWDEELLELFNVPRSGLPEVKDCVDDFGTCSLLGEDIPILGVAGDQQAAAIGQACFEEGDIKSTYGTGCFVILNTGETCVTSDNRLLSTICYRFDGQVTYALEGSIFIAGAAVQWLRDEVKIIDHAKDTEKLCRSLDSNKGVYLVPAFTGLGAPHWDPDARGGLFGLTRDTGRAEIVRATIESVCYQTYDLFKAMAQDGVEPKILRVDGGMVANDWMVQYLAGVLNIPVERPKVLETTAFGAAALAAIGAGIFPSLETIKEVWKLDTHFDPEMDAETRKTVLAGWKTSVQKVLTD
ncbi:glycerol kinase GlpK [Litorimonas haliclonae]|uniref:glycerol kinase GlpK n=1 Tax=Litorimonas haliclonae TaxID=2081977 RepID=UPI0039EEE2E9